ncbi:MAG: TIGR04442 family protein [bacterium]
MIKDYRIHGEMGENMEFFATLWGDDLGHRYFHEVTEHEGVRMHRFFYGGSEFLLGPETITHAGNGGSFCSYMFGVDEPIEDLVKSEVVNRLVLFGALDDDEGIRITGRTRGTETLREVFLRGHAVFNYYFFIHLKDDRPLKGQQEAILKVLGRTLKRYRLNLDLDDSRIAEELSGLWSAAGKAFFLLRLVNNSHLKYYKQMEKLYSSPMGTLDEGVRELELLGKELGIDPYSQERMKIDILNQHPENRRILEEYKSVLVEIWKRDSILFDDRARMSRLRTLALRKGIPFNMLDLLDEKLLGEKKFHKVEEPAYLVEARGILETVFFRTRQMGIHLEKSDLIRLLKSKLTALENRDPSFDRILIDVGKVCDEQSTKAGDPGILEEFGNIVTYFDRFDAVYNALNALAFHEGENLTENKLRSLLQNREIFEEIRIGLFRELFVAPILMNPYLPGYGMRKVEYIFEGLAKIESADISVMDLLRVVDRIVTEEREYKLIKTAMERWLKKFERSMKGADEEKAFIADVMKMLVSRQMVRPQIPEEFFHRALEDLKMERHYVKSILPRIIKVRDSTLRNEFIRTSGIEVLRLEELEKGFLAQYRIDDRVLDEIRSS